MPIWAWILVIVGAFALGAVLVFWMFLNAFEDFWRNIFDRGDKT